MFKCSCGLTYAEQSYVENKSCRICRSQKQFDLELNTLIRRSSTKKYTKEISSVEDK